MKNLLLLFILTLAYCPAATSDAGPPVGSDHVLNADAAQENERETWIGRWAGEANAEGGVYRWLLIRESDGTFMLHGRMYQDGVAVYERLETGEWTVVDGFYITKTNAEWDGEKFIPVESWRPNFWGIYRVGEVRDDKISYHHDRLNKTYVNRRVGDDYELPPKG